MASPTRIQRLIRLLGLLQGGRSFNTRTLSEECGVSRRTIFRDLEDLRDAGVPLRFDEERQLYHIPGKYFQPPNHFTTEETLAVMILCHELGDPRKLPFYSAARGALEKMETALPEHLREYTRNIASAIEIQLDTTTADPEQQQSVHDQLIEAIAQRKSVRISYRPPAAETFSTRLSPYQLLFRLHCWYVIGRSSLHRSVRTFNVSRIESAELLEDEYEIPRNFSVQRHLRNAWRLIPEQGSDHQVVLLFQPRVAQNVAEVCWHHTQEIQWLKDGTLKFSVTVSGLEEISWWIMGYGDQVRVEKPDALIEIIRDRARRVADLYQGHK